MPRKSLPPAGITAFNPTGWHITIKDRNKILAAVHLSLDDATDFLKDIETAVLMTWCRKELHVKSSEIKRSIEATAEAAADLLAALNKIPDAGRQLYRHAGLPYQMAHQMAGEILQAADQANNQSKSLLSGAGNEQDNNPWILASDIHHALTNIGIKPTCSRIKENQIGRPWAGPFWKITDICFDLCKMSRSDLYPYLNGACTGDRVNIERD